MSSKLHFLSSTKNDSKKEELYLAVRKQENRIYSDEEVSKLPKCNKTHTHYKEWKIRAHSAEKLFNYLHSKKHFNILEVGCGNGWLSSYLSQLQNSSIYAIDLNKIELEQATRVFANANIQFYYADIFNAFNPEFKFDAIVLAASTQYFPDFYLLIKRLIELLKIDGEIHIIDTPFYTREQLSSAKERTPKYYRSLGFEQMKNFYHHKSWDDLKPFTHRIKKTGLLNKLKLLIKYKSAFEFPWVIISKELGGGI